MQVTVLVALIAFVSGAIVSWLQHGFSRHLESTKTLTTLRNEAYVSLIKAISGLAISRKANDHHKELEFTIMLVEAKARIIMYADPAVVQSVARAVTHASFDAPEATQALVEMISTMRRYGGASGGTAITSEAIAQLLLGGENERGQ